MLSKNHPTFVALAIGTLGTASIIGSYKLAKIENLNTTYQAEARQTSVIDNYKATSSLPPNIPKGFVTGKLCYPAKILPEGKIVAKNVDSGIIYTLYYPGNARSSYNFVLIPGKYKLRYETFIGTNQLKPNAGYYAQETDESNNPAIVEVESDKTVSGIDLCYYYPPKIEPEF